MDLAAATARSLWSLVSVPSAFGAYSPDHESFSAHSDTISNGSNGTDDRGTSGTDSMEASRYCVGYWNHRTIPSAPVLDSAATTRIATSLMSVDEESDQGQTAEIGISDIVSWFFPSLSPDVAPSSGHARNCSPSAPSSGDPSAAPDRSSTPSTSSSPARQAALRALTRNYVARSPAARAASAKNIKAISGDNPFVSLASLLLGASALRAMGNLSVWSALVKRLKNKYWLVALAVAMAALPFMGLVSYVISLHVQNLYDRHLRTEWLRLFSSITAGIVDSDEYDEDDDFVQQPNTNDDDEHLVDPARIKRNTFRLHHHPPTSPRYSDGSDQRRRVDDVRPSEAKPQRHDRSRNRRSANDPRSSTSSTASCAALDRRTRGRPATRSSAYSQFTDEPPRLSSPLYSPLADQNNSTNNDLESPLSTTAAASKTPDHPPSASSTIQPDDILQLTYELDHLRTLLAHEAAQEQMLRGEIATMREVLAGVLAQMRGLQEVQGRLLDAAAFASMSGSQSPSMHGRRRNISLSPALAPEGGERALSASPVRRVPSGLRLDLLNVPPAAAKSGRTTSPPSLVISPATPPQVSPRSPASPSAANQSPHSLSRRSSSEILATNLGARRRAVRSSLSKISDTQLKAYLVEAVLRGNCSNVRQVLEHVNERLESEPSEQGQSSESVTGRDKTIGPESRMVGNQGDEADSSMSSSSAAISVACVESPVTATTASPPTPPTSPSPGVFIVNEPEVQLPPPEPSSQPDEARAPAPSALLAITPAPASTPPSPMPGSMPLSPPMVKEPLLPTLPVSSYLSSRASTPQTPSSAQLVHPNSQKSSSSSSASKRPRPTPRSFTLNPPARYSVVATPGRIPPRPTSMFSNSPSLPDQNRPHPPAGRVSWHTTSSSSQPSHSTATVLGLPPYPAPSLATTASPAARRKARSDIGPRST